MAVTARWNKGRRRRLSIKLAKLKPEIARELAPVVEGNARMVHEIQLRLAPEDDGDLKDSLGYYEVAGFQGLKWRVVAGDEKAFYAKMVEFGTPRNAASPFFYPAYRAVRRLLRSRMSRAVRKAVKRIASIR
jgi:HK97 gp10 family phage protein